MSIPARPIGCAGGSPRPSSGSPNSRGSSPRRTTIRHGYRELQEAVARDQAANAALATLNELQGRHRAAEKRVESARNLLLQEQHALDHQAADLQRQRERLPEIESDLHADRRAPENGW